MTPTATPVPTAGNIMGHPLRNVFQLVHFETEMPIHTGTYEECMAVLSKDMGYDLAEHTIHKYRLDYFNAAGTRQRLFALETLGE